MSIITEKKSAKDEPNVIKRPTTTSRTAPNDRITPSSPFKPACVLAKVATIVPNKTTTIPILEPTKATFKIFIAFADPIVAFRYNF